MKPPHLRVPVRPPVTLWPLFAILPALALAAWSLGEPWAKGRVFVIWGVSRSPDAALLIAATIAGLVVLTVTGVFHSRRLGWVGGVHLVMGAVMLAVGLVAYMMVREAAPSFLGLVSVASVKPAGGLWWFLVAAGLVAAQGGLEMAVAARRRRGRRVVTRSEEAA